MGELRLSSGDEYEDQGTTTLYVGPRDGEFAAFQPGAENPMSYDDLKVIEASSFVRSIADGVPHGAGLDDAVRAAAVLDAISRSAATRAWVTPASLPEPPPESSR